MAQTEIIENNYEATAKPTSTDDNSKGYGKFSQWSYNGITYECIDGTIGNAQWVIESDLGYYNLILFGSGTKLYVEFKNGSTLLYRIKYNGRTKSKISSINLDISGNSLKSNGTPDTATLSIYESIGGTEVATVTWNENDRTNIEMNIVGTFPDEDCFLEFYGETTANNDKGRIHAITLSS